MVESGQIFTATRVFSQEEFDAFAALSGDDNPIHVDPAFAARTRFGRPVAHGMLLYGVICGLLSRHFLGAVQQEQSLMFPAPTFAGDEMMVSAEVVAQDDDQVTVATRILDPGGQVTCIGETILTWA